MSDPDLNTCLDAVGATLEGGSGYVEITGREAVDLAWAGLLALPQAHRVALARQLVAESDWTVAQIAQRADSGDAMTDAILAHADEPPKHDLVTDEMVRLGERRFREHKGGWFEGWRAAITAVAPLIAATERKACARVVDVFAIGALPETASADTAKAIAAAIRARGTP
jgi:hypothetical protein